MLPAAEDLTFPAAEGREMRAVFATAGPERPLPGVIVIHELLGLNDDIRNLTRRVAALGYAALAPDLFDRPGLRWVCVARTVAALRRGRWKLVRGPGAPELYDLEADPGETRDLSQEHPDRTRELLAALEGWTEEMREEAAARGTLAVPSTEPHPVQQQEALRALGYLE